MANFLRGDDSYEESIKLYSEILSKITRDHKLYPRVLDRRGTAYERIGKWELGEKDLMQSLEILPDQAYTINYLAYTWIEKEKNTRKALTMLKKANTLKENDGYITDSLGWALYRRGDYKEAVSILELAVEQVPYDPVINDHLGDAYWKVGRKKEARYQWQRAINNREGDTQNALNTALLEKKIEQGL